jgi:hypothetical protein
VSLPLSRLGQEPGMIGQSGHLLHDIVKPLTSDTWGDFVSVGSRPGWVLCGLQQNEWKRQGCTFFLELGLTYSRETLLLVRRERERQETYKVPYIVVRKTRSGSK